MCFGRVLPGVGHPDGKAAFGVGLETEMRIFESALERSAGCKLARGADFHSFAGSHEPDDVGRLKGEVELVGGDEDGSLGLVRQATEEEKRFDAVGEVEMRSGLVEQDEGRLLGERFGDECALLLAIGKLVEIAVGLVSHFGLFERVADAVFVLFREAAEEGGVGVTAHGNCVVDGSAVGRKSFGKDHGHPFCSLVLGHLEKIVRPDVTGAPESGLQIGQCADECGFSAAVLAEETDHVAFVRLETEVLLNDRLTVADGEIMSG